MAVEFECLVYFFYLQAVGLTFRNFSECLVAALARVSWQVICLGCGKVAKSFCWPVQSHGREWLLQAGMPPQVMGMLEGVLCRAKAVCEMG